MSLPDILCLVKPFISEGPSIEKHTSLKFSLNHLAWFILKKPFVIILFKQRVLFSLHFFIAYWINLFNNEKLYVGSPPPWKVKSIHGVFLLIILALFINIFTIFLYLLKLRKLLLQLVPEDE